MIYESPTIYENLSKIGHNFKTLTYNLIEPSKFSEFVLKVDKDEVTGLLLVGFYCKFTSSTPLHFYTVAQVSDLSNTRNTNFILVNDTGDKLAFLQLAADGYIKIDSAEKNLVVGSRYILRSPGITLDV